MAGKYQPFCRQAKGEQATETFGELGFLPGELKMLGLAYVFRNQDNIQHYERTIQAGISRAFCLED